MLSSRHTLDPPLADAPPRNGHGPSKLDILSKTLLSPFSRHRPDSTSILTDLAPVIMTPRIINAATSSRAERRQITAYEPPSALSTLTRRLITDPAAAAVANAILELDLPSEQTDGPSLLRGYQATNPSSGKSRARRREVRASAVDNDRALAVPSRKRGRESLTGKGRTLPQEELTRQTNEIVRDKDDISVRRAVLTSDINTVNRKIEELEAVRQRLENELLRLAEDELELEDELEGVLDNLSHIASRPVNSSRPSYTSSQRRRKGPAFLPSEHDNLPPGLAFMTLTHPQPLCALDFSAPYDLLVSSSASQADFALHVWDLSSGSEMRRLAGHRSPVKALQVEDNLCVTGGSEGHVRVWDLSRLSEWEDVNIHSEVQSETGTAEDLTDEFGRMNWSTVEKEPSKPSSVAAAVEDSSCLRVLEGHSGGITALYFENECLVTGASDKTLRQWDLNTGQCVMTMDILWAMSNSSSTASRRQSSGRRLSRRAPSYQFDAVDLTGAIPGFENYHDFVGGVQFWGYALISGSADGGVRMWDMRTGQAHRTLLGHTAPITCLQFDETHIITGSLDKSIRIWDMRTGTVSDTLLYDNPISDLQFDSRKIVACCGENTVKIYNRTTQQTSALSTNGHTQPAQVIRYMDRYLVSGGLDSTVKVWAL